MKYKHWNYLRLKFHDNVYDIKGHPYIVLLDSNNCHNKDFLLIKCQTFYPIKHSIYVENESSIIVELKRKSIADISKPYELKKSKLNEEYEGVVSDFEFNNIARCFIDIT